jgi:DNA-binding CsgD family transcriptional regulator
MPQQSPLRMLRCLKEDPSRSLATVARLVERSERSVHRWWKEYQKGGIDAILHKGEDESKPNRVDRKVLQELQRLLQTREVGTMEEVQRILQERFGIQMSLPAVSTLLQKRLKARRVWIIDNPHAATNGATPGCADSRSADIPARLLHFLNRLPVTCVMQDWVFAFRTGLLELLGDVDHMSINLNADCDLRKPEEYSNDIVVFQHLTTPQKRSQLRGMSAALSERRISKLMLQGMRSQGFPVTKYHPPIAYDYFLAETAYVATIVLWRERHKRPISQKTQDLMQQLEPYLVFMMSDCVARHQNLDPTTRLFNDIVSTSSSEAHLTKREKEVLALHLMSRSQESIAKDLFITVDAVRKHMKSIYKKTGTHNARELFAKYFTPLQDLPDEN